MKKLISVILCIAILSGVLFFASSAEGNEGIAPCLNNTDMAATGFVIENGVGYVTLSYAGYPGITTGATITTKIQKQFLFFFWTDVDIGMPNNQWVDNVNVVNYLGEHTVSIKEKGTYKAVVQYVIRGTGGADDVLNAEVEFEYK